MINDEKNTLAESSPSELVMQAALATKRCLAEQSLPLTGNMTRELPPQMQRFESEPAESNASVEHLLRRLVSTIEALSLATDDDPTRSLAEARLKALVDLAKAALPESGGNDCTLNRVEANPRNDDGVDHTILIGLAKRAGAGLWTTDSDSGDDAQWTVWHADGDSVCRCYSAIGAMPEAVDAEDVARFIAAVSPAKIIQIAEDNIRLRELLSLEQAVARAKNRPTEVQGIPEDTFAQNLDTCPGCLGPADNGHSRDVPPSPYYCKACNSVPTPEIS